MTAPHSTRGFADVVGIGLPTYGRRAGSFDGAPHGGHTRLSRILVIAVLPVAVALAVLVHWIDEITGPASPEEAAVSYLNAYFDGRFETAWTLACSSRKLAYDFSYWNFYEAGVKERRKYPQMEDVDFRVKDIETYGEASWRVTVVASLGNRSHASEVDVHLDGDEYRVC